MEGEAEEAEMEEEGEATKGCPFGDEANVSQFLNSDTSSFQ